MAEASVGVGVIANFEVAMALPEAPRSAHGASARLFVLALGVLIVIALAPVSIGLASALVLYEIWVRPYTWLARKIPARLAAFVVTLASFVLVAAPLIWLGHHLVARLPAVRAAMASSGVPAGANSAAGTMPSLQAQLAQAGGTVTDRLRDVLPALGHSAAWTLMNWSIALLGLFYLLGSAACSLSRHYTGSCRWHSALGSRAGCGDRDWVFSRWIARSSFLGCIRGNRDAGPGRG